MAIQNIPEALRGYFANRWRIGNVENAKVAVEFVAHNGSGVLSIGYHKPAPLLRQRFIYIDGNIADIPEAEMDRRIFYWEGQPLEKRDQSILITRLAITLLPCHLVGDYWISSGAVGAGVLPSLDGIGGAYEDSPGGTPAGSRADQVFTIKYVN